jgi:hypothetical protein
MASKTKNKEQRAMSKVRGASWSRLPFALCYLLIAHLYCSFELYSQNLGYFLDTSGEEPRFIQYLSWEGSEYVSRYEVVIEGETASGSAAGYRELLREFTIMQFIEVSLMPGKYRCYVTPYDLLGQPRARSDWMYIEVLAALYPELDDSLGEFVYSDNDLVYEMNISGKGLVPGADIHLRAPNGEHIVPVKVHVKEDGTEVQLFFDKDQLAPGDFELFVKNPGGLEANRGLTVIVRESTVPESTELPELADAPPKKFNLFLGAAWMPSVTLYDKGDRFFDDGWSPIGAVIRLGIVFTKPDLIYLGVELTEAWSVLYDGSDRRATHLDSTVNFLMQKRSPSAKTALTFRLGAGFSLPLFGYNEKPPFTDLLYTNIGISLLVIVWKGLYLEGGVDYAHWFSRPFSGNIRPWFGIGLRF